VPKVKKSAVVEPATPPAHFFEKQLAGEEPPALDTMKRLYDEAARFGGFAPWEVFSDQQLVLIEDPVSKEICYCSIMGALGEVFSLHVYIGPQSYGFFKSMEAREQVTPEDFFSLLRGVSVEFVLAAELTAPDKELLRALGHPHRRGSRSPIFRAYRPGYQPWYVTQREATTLAECLEAANALFAEIVKHEDLSYWDEPDTYPFLVRRNDPETKSYEIRKVKAPRPPAAAPPPVEVDQSRVRRLQAKDYSVKGIFEGDHFHFGAVLGGKNERKAYGHAALIVDAGSGLVFPPKVGEATHSAGNLLADAVLDAIESAQLLPAELRVKKDDFKTLLEPVAQQLGITVLVVKSLPALQRAQKHLFEFLGR